MKFRKIFKYINYIIFHKLYHLLYGEVSLKRLITLHWLSGTARLHLNNFLSTTFASSLSRIHDHTRKHHIRDLNTKNNN